MRLFYDPNITIDSNKHTLSEEESKHIVKVLRMKETDRIGVLDGSGQLFETTIIDAHPKRCILQIDTIVKEEPDNFHIHIAVGPTKQMDRIEWFVEKATEIGIHEITLIDTDNGERNKSKIERLEKKAVSAMKQSKRFYLPKINPLTDLKEFIKEHPNGLIAHCYEDDKSTISDSWQKLNCPIIIGPEGDFTLAEIEHALENGYKTITFGKNRLRTETAALYACFEAIKSIS